MTKDNEVDLLIEDKPQQPQKEPPFQIALVDIEEAAKNHRIHCVEAPLEASEEDDEALEYVALSYRWGELHETVIDTQLEYTASITSFALNDFYKLCNMMTHESDLKHIKYVWVDAICVDQVNYERRKATIYRMTNIYEQARYIVAVPDLHAAHLRNTMIKIDDIMKGTSRYCNDIYYLIHGNSEQLAVIEEKFLDDARVPNDPAFGQWLKTYTDHFMDGFMKYKEYYVDYNSVEALDHLYEANHLRTASLPKFSHDQCAGDNDDVIVGDDSFEGLHHCDKVDCPLVFFDDGVDIQRFFGKTSMWSGRNNSAWKQLIYERSDSIRQSMEFLADLIVDWSTRVWVISEFSIAKKKNNLKFWFIHLVPDYRLTLQKGFSFFKFDFNDLSHSTTDNDWLFATRDMTAKTRSFSSNPVYLKLHYTMTRQLSHQTFLEKILKSKVSVKLKLFEWMNTRDKLNLLFWSGATGSSNIGTILPTFATSTLSLTFPGDYLQTNYLDETFNVYPWIIKLHRTNDTIKNGSPIFYLHLETKRYYSIDHLESWFDSIVEIEEKVTLFKRRLQFDDLNDRLDVICITVVDRDWVGTRDDNCGAIFLVGIFEKNKWILDRRRRAFGYIYRNDWTLHEGCEHYFDFDIY